MFYSHFCELVLDSFCCLFATVIVVEAEGNIDTEVGADMIAALAEYCDNLRVVGSYTKDN